MSGLSRLGLRYLKQHDSHDSNAKYEVSEQRVAWNLNTINSTVELDMGGAGWGNGTTFAPHLPQFRSTPGHFLGASDRDMRWNAKPFVPQRGQ